MTVATTNQTVLHDDDDDGDHTVQGDESEDADC